MTTARQVRQLAKPLLARHPDLVLTGRTLTLLPVRHIVRRIEFLSSPRADDFYPTWILTEMFLPWFDRSEAIGRCNERLAHPVRGWNWSWSDPAMADDLVHHIETKILPMLRSLDTFRTCLSFIRRHPETIPRLDQSWSMVTDIACGDLDAARSVWGQIGHRYRDGRRSSDPQLRYRPERYAAIGEPLLAGDRTKLASLLHAWEAENICGGNMEPYWQWTPFPLEDHL
ncbi:hypothetical protein [Methylobacterium trifolii]|uniref:Uncharacterized protein n=1 Tax=Methylobacterium trifolii TaxID=1003092 RepID=A0ABQ4U1D7_9HYPH|nr:hypothetical protein [Methylobacterium trifolii]GJE60962.1 hypothetical protein MPOCJGCO_3081 [Methylobacterium trifolii]